MTLTKTEKKKKIEYVCYNPECFNSLTYRPKILLGSVCWNCDTNKWFKVLKNEL